MIVKKKILNTSHLQPFTSSNCKIFLKKIKKPSQIYWIQDWQRIFLPPCTFRLEHHDQHFLKRPKIFVQREYSIHRGSYFTLKIFGGEFCWITISSEISCNVQTLHICLSQFNPSNKKIHPNSNLTGCVIKLLQ